MNDWLGSPDQSQHRRDGVTIPTIWVAIALSLFLHIVLMWKWLPQLHLPSLATPANETLVVHLSPPPGPPPALSSSRAIPAPLSSAPETRRSARALRAPQGGTEKSPPPIPPVLAAQKPVPNIPPPPPAAAIPAAPLSTSPSSSTDLATYVEAQRRGRGQAAPTVLPTENDKTRSERIVAANLAQRSQAFGYDPEKSGGIFELRYTGVYNAAFMFNGWNKDARHNTTQLIEVQKADNSNIRIAVVRRMIAIIRDYAQGDFTFASQRLGRDVTLSARARDNEGLENFMMREFYGN